MNRGEKPVYWVGNARDELRSFPVGARKQAGVELMAVQQGLEPSDWRPMPAIGKGVREIRIHDGNEYRVIYIVRHVEGIYILHCFIKKSQKTARRDIELARDRLKAITKQLRRK